MIAINNVRKSYKGIEVLNVPALGVAEGESFGLVGNNGAGKTTLFRIILDLIKPNEGEVKIKENSIQGKDDWKSFTGSYLDEGFLIGFLTPDEYFYFVGGLHGLSKSDIDDFLNQFEEIFSNEIRGVKKYIRDLSKGNQKKVGIAAALIGNPEIVILDEPFANLDPTAQIRLKKLLQDVKSQYNTTMIISSHDLNHVTEVCERIVVLEKGQIVKDIKTEVNTLQELEEFFT
ncbi:MAG: ABC transporter ATP-binding protein [Bacteroidota bacterium]